MLSTVSPPIRTASSKPMRSAGSRVGLSVHFGNLAQVPQGDVPDLRGFDQMRRSPGMADHPRLRIAAEQVPHASAVVDVDVSQENEVDCIYTPLFQDGEEGRDRRCRTRVHDHRCIMIGIKPACDKVPKPGHRQWEIHHVEMGRRGCLIHFIHSGNVSDPLCVK